jgi:transposase InsO family protein
MRFAAIGGRDEHAEGKPYGVISGRCMAGAGGFEPPHGGIKIRYLADIPCSGTGRCIAIAARHRPNHSQRIVAPSGGTGFCGIAIQMRSRPIHEPEGKLLGQRPMESYFGTMKTELVHQVRYPTRDAAQRDLFSYIEGYYNRQRLHSVLGYITPEQAERQAA